MFSTLQFKAADFNTFDLGGGTARIELAFATTDFLTSQSNQNVTAQNGGFAFQTLSFSNANGISFGTSAGSAITGSHNALTSQSNQAFSAAGGSSTFQTLSFNNANGATFSNVGGAVQLSYTVPSIPAAQTGISGIQVSDNTFTSGTVTFRNANGISFGSSGANGVSASHNALTSQSNQAASASNGSFAFQTLNFSDANGVTFGTSAGSIITASVGAAGGGLTNINVSAGTTSQNLSNLVFSNSNGVSFGLNGSTITASVDAGGGGFTGHIEKWPIYLQLAAGQSLVSGTSGNTGASTQLTVSAKIHPWMLECPLTMNRTFYVPNFSTTSGSYHNTLGFFGALYTLSGGTLSLLTDKTWQFNMIISQNSITARTVTWWWGTNSAANSSSLSGNISGTFTGSRMMIFRDGIAESLSPGMYYHYFGHTARSSGTNGAGASNVFQGNNVRMHEAARLINNFNNNNLASWEKPHGALSTTTNTNSTGFGVFPASIHTSVLSIQANSAYNPEICFDFTR